VDEETVTVVICTFTIATNLPSESEGLPDFRNNSLLFGKLMPKKWISDGQECPSYSFCASISDVSRPYFALTWRSWMNSAPETRPSLLLRLREPRDERAWLEFWEIYQPLIYRLARRRGIQDADAHEITQDVLLAVARAVETWQPDPNCGSFRGWLNRVTRNLTVNLVLRQQRRPQSTGNVDFQKLLEEIPIDPEESAVFDHEHKRQMFQWAALQIRGEFRETSWLAFWRTTVEGQDVAIVAEQLGVTSGVVYVSRSRIMARLRKKVQEVSNV
jgi:RNA polymerase sigma factor (sigma-70 family)